MEQLSPYVAIFAGIFVVYLVVLWAVLPFAVFGIKRILKKIEKNTGEIEKNLKLLNKK